jgi:hypothetical protein
LIATASCVPDPPAADGYGLRARLGDGEITLEWRQPGSTPVAVYEVQSLSSTGQWQPLMTTPSTTATVTEVVNRTRYRFRVRSAATGSSAAGTWSSVVDAVYVDLLLPTVRIDTEGDAPILDRENYVRGTMSLDPNGSGYAAYTGTLGIRGRGNSTWALPKKPYRMKLDSASPMMGIAAERDWVLLANYVDKSQLRTFAAGEISRATDLAYTPTFRHVEVVLNGEYLGVYQLTQHVEVGPDRVDVTRMSSSDIAGEAVTGGYLMEVDARLEENDEPGFRTGKSVPVVVKDPDPMTAEQRSYIRNHVQAFENSLFAPNFTDPVNGYRRYLDIDAFADHYLVQELAKNQDTFYSSTYFTKQRGDDRLRFGPMWDFDRSMGTTRTVEDLGPEGWRARTRGAWSTRLFQDPLFVDRVEQRWEQFLPSFATLPDRIESLGAELRPAIANDEARWDYSLAGTDTPEYLGDWLRTRITWIDQEFDTP